MTLGKRGLTNWARNGAKSYGDLMYAYEVLLILSIAGLFLFLVTKRSVYYEKIERRSDKNRRKSFFASKNLMRRSGKDRRINTDRKGNSSSDSGPENIDMEYRWFDINRRKKD